VHTLHAILYALALIPDSAANVFIHSLPSILGAHGNSLKVSLHGLLAATGMGHMNPHAVLLGLMGEDPATVEVGRSGRVIVTYLNSGPQNGYSGTRTRICAVLLLH
jgi:hypothetical protein